MNIERNTQRRFRGLSIALSAALCFVAAGAAWAAPKEPATVKVTIAGLGCTNAPLNADTFLAQSWSWGTALQLSSAGSGGGRVGKTLVSGVTLTKALDACSAALLAAIPKGKLFETMTLVQVDASGQTLATISLSKALLTGYQVNGVPGQTPSESVVLEFQKICIKPQGSNAETCYDQASANQ